MSRWAESHLRTSRIRISMLFRKINVGPISRVKEEATLDFRLPAEVLGRRIRAFNPFPGAVGNFAGTPVKLWNASVVNAPTAALPGDILAANAVQGVLVACGEGVLRVTELQKPGGKRLPAAEFLKGFPMEGGRFA